MEIISRKNARKKSLTKFFTGLPCSEGHVARRYVASGNCEVCAAWYNRKANVKNRVRLQFAVHEGDVEAVQALVAALAMTRGDPVPDVLDGRTSEAKRNRIKALAATTLAPKVTPGLQDTP